MANEVISALMTRRAIRAFKPEQITDEELMTVLEAGTWAPSGRGMQSAQMVVVQNEELMKQIVRMNGEVLGDTSRNPYYGAPTVILVFAPEDRTTYVEDGSCLLDTLMVAAESIGLGSCWIHRERQMFETEEGKQLMAQWGLAPEMKGIGALSLGYIEGEKPEPKPRREGYYTIIK
ncbi:MAG: nitroreductase [Eubacterium sp.]|nr:nitroreductase [Candidatus Colimonas fimequi]